MAIPNVDKITSTLARLPDQALQQYAAMHKNDPYIMSLAMSESNRRKEVRAAAQGMQGAQPQPKVVDAALAQMAPPQEQGIATLPAPNMQMMADGGIAGYEGYGEGDESYGQEPVMMMAGGGAVERYNGQAGSLTGDIPGFVAGTGNFIPQQGAPEEVPLFRRMFRDARATGASYQIEQAKARIAAGVGTSADEAILAAAQSEQNKGPSAQDMAMFDAASDLYMTERANKQAANKPAAGPTPPAADKKRGAAPRPGTGDGAAAAKTDTGGLDALINNFTRSTDLAQGELRNQRVGLAAQLEQEAKGVQEEGEKRRKERGDVFAGKEARLAEREKGVEGMKDQNLGLALLQAGAAMMSTPGNIGAALGKGIQVGSERFIAGMDKINAAKDKFAEARDRLEDLRINRDDMNEKEIREEQRAIRTARLDGQKLMLDGATNDLKISSENQKAIFGVAAESILTDKKIQGQKEAARISANQTPAQMQIALALGKGNLEEGLNKMKSIEAGKFSVSNSYADYLKAFAGKDTLTPPLTFANYAAQFGAVLPR